MAIAQRGPVTAELKRLLEDHTARPIWVGRAPLNPDTGEVEAEPYAIIYPVPGTFFGPIWFNPNEDALFDYQIDSIGLRADQAEWMADKIRFVLLDRFEDTGHFRYPMEPEGMTVMDRWPDEGSPGQNRPEGNIFRVVDTYRIAVTTS